MTKVERARQRLEQQAYDREIVAAASDAVFATMSDRAALQFFGKRGFSSRTVKALAERGMVLPEELLFLTDDDITDLAVLGASVMEEVRIYRARFLGDRGTKLSQKDPLHERRACQQCGIGELAITRRIRHSGLGPECELQTMSCSKCLYQEMRTQGIPAE